MYRTTSNAKMVAFSGPVIMSPPHPPGESIVHGAYKEPRFWIFRGRGETRQQQIFCEYLVLLSDSRLVDTQSSTRIIWINIIHVLIFYSLFIKWFVYGFHYIVICVMK